MWLAYAAPAAAWDYTTSNPCQEPVAHQATPDVAYTADGSLPAAATGIPSQTGQTQYSATVDLNIPLSSKIDTSAYNADLSRSEIDVGTALVTQDGAYVNVLGNETPAPAAAGTLKQAGCH